MGDRAAGDRLQGQRGQSPDLADPTRAAAAGRQVRGQSEGGHGGSAAMEGEEVPLATGRGGSVALSVSNPGVENQVPSRMGLQAG